MKAYIYARKVYQKLKLYSAFKNVTAVKDKYNQWFWKERKHKIPFRIVSHKESAGIEYYIIRRYASNMGLGSYIISNLSQINYAIQKEYVPVIDMLNYNSTKFEDKYVNTWELYFNQIPGILNETYMCKEYWLSDGGCKSDAPNDSITFLLDNSKLEYWHNLFDAYCTFNSLMQEYAMSEYKNLFAGRGRILGVLCRGTDYLKLRPKSHPIQPEIHDVINKAREVMKQYKCGYLYLATEDYLIEKAFVNVFSDKVIVNKRVYKSYENGYLASTETNRRNDAYFTNREYLSSLYLLSKCNCFIAGRTSGTVITMLMNYQYEYTYFWDLGLY